MIAATRQHAARTALEKLERTKARAKKEQETTEEAYDGMRGLIYGQVNKFYNRYGGDYEELEGDANLAFAQGHQYFIRGVRANGDTITHPYHIEIRRWVWFTLIDTMRNRLRRDAIVRIDTDGESGDWTEEVEATTFENNCFDIAVFGRRLSERGREVLMLILDGPPELMRRANKRGGTPRNIRRVVREWLAFMDWTPAEINDTFEEIKTAL